MRFIILIKATPSSEAGILPGEPFLTEMARYHEQLVKAGALLDASGLYPTAKGWRIRYVGGKRVASDGPFTGNEGLIAGYTLIQVQSKAEAVEWSRRFPNSAIDGEDDEIEVRQLLELEDLDASAVERFRALGIGTGI
ncbi:MAG: YciI family protein [Candidatus Competibacteraceae bacterium]|nr:YciI family protein [Candidatus Competibacteraceae bacterium]